MKDFHFKLVGEDWWGNPIYKCIENGRIYKDVDWDPDKPNLNTCDNEIDGEPGFPIRKDINIIIVE